MPFILFQEIRQKVIYGCFLFFNNSPQLISLANISLISHYFIPVQQESQMVLTLLPFGIRIEHLQRILQKQYRFMHKQQLYRFSIKTKLEQCLSAQKENAISSPPPQDGQSKIYMPEFHNYFLHTIEKEIKHEGNLLKRIKRKIEDFKEKKVEKKRIKNARHHYSHLMFTSQSLRKTHTQKTPNELSPSAPFEELQKRYMNSATSSARETLKVKTSSFSTNFPNKQTNNRVKTACHTRQGSNIQSQNSTFNPSRSSVYNENQLIQRYGKLVKHGKRNAASKQELQVMGGRPQWNNFESYRNNSTYLMKKRL